MLKGMIVVVGLCCGSFALAQPAGGDKPAAPKPMPAPKAGAEMDALKGWLKNWTCTGKAWDPMTKAEDTYKVTIKQKLDLGGFWAPFTYTRTKGKMMPAFAGWGISGYDAANKRYLLHGYDSWGGTIMLSGAGPKGNALVYEGEGAMAGNKMPFKMTFTMDEKAKTMSLTAETAGGQKLFEDACK